MEKSDADKLKKDKVYELFNEFSNIPYNYINLNYIQTYLRNNYNISIEVNSVWDYRVKGFVGYTFTICNNNPDNKFIWDWKIFENKDLYYNSYEKALLEGLYLFFQSPKDFLERDSFKVKNRWK